MERLDRAYRATVYLVEGPRGRFGIRVDQACLELDRLLAQHEAEVWAFVTAYNPGSVPTDDARNRQRQADLEREVREAGYPVYPGAGVGADAGWPPEPSLLVVGLDADIAVELGRRYGQRAVVAGRRSGPARLLYT